MVDEDDYLVWKSHYGKAVSAALTTGVGGEASHAQSTVFLPSWNDPPQVPSAKKSGWAGAVTDVIRTNFGMSTQREFEQLVMGQAHYPRSRPPNVTANTADWPLESNDAVHEIIWEGLGSERVSWQVVRAWNDAFAESILTSGTQ